jgi:hypothetical protein
LGILGQCEAGVLVGLLHDPAERGGRERRIVAGLGIGVECKQLGPVVDRLTLKRELGDAVAEAAVGQLGAVLV